MSKRTKLLIAGAIGVMAIPITVFAQGATKANGSDTLYFNTNVGSFKILGAATSKANGDVDITCKGTVLVSGLEGNIDTTGFKQEIDDRDLQKRVYFGNGRIHIKGKFSGIQFFGRDMKAVWSGWGVVRLFGEFDKNLNTGEYWYGGETEHRPWFNGGMTVMLPKPEQMGGGGTVAPRIRDKG